MNGMTLAPTRSRVNVLMTAESLFPCQNYFLVLILNLISGPNFTPLTQEERKEDRIPIPPASGRGVPVLERKEYRVLL